jgi:hypothetical protein
MNFRVLGDQPLSVKLLNVILFSYYPFKLFRAKDEKLSRNVASRTLEKALLVVAKDYSWVSSMESLVLPQSQSREPKKMELVDFSKVSQTH